MRLIKQLLRRVLAKASVTYENMLTILCDCEAIINARLLTYISADCTDLKALTSSIFLQEMREIGVPDLDALTAIDIHEKSRYHQRLKGDLRRQFRPEYLGQLRENAKFIEIRELIVDDLVFVGDENQKRIDWPLRRVKTVFVCPDGNARVRRIKIQAGELTCPVQRLYSLELDRYLVSEVDKVSNDLVKTKIYQERKKYDARPKDNEKIIEKYLREHPSAICNA